MNPYKKQYRKFMSQEELDSLTQEEKDAIRNGEVEFVEDNFEPVIRHFRDESGHDDDLQNIPHFRD